MDRIPRRMYVAIAALVAATLALAILAGTATAQSPRLEFLALAAVAAALALGLLLKLQVRTRLLVSPTARRGLPGSADRPAQPGVCGRSHRHAAEHGNR